MSEWSKEHDWKSCELKGSAGSNPVLCASSSQHAIKLNFLQTKNCKPLSGCSSTFNEHYINSLKVIAKTEFLLLFTEQNVLFKEKL